MMLIDVEVPVSLQLQIKSSVMREEFQHVIEKTDPGRYLIAATAFDRQRNLNLRFLAHSLDMSLSHARDAPCAIPNSSCVCRNALSKLSACSRGPRVMRTHPSHPRSADRSLTRIPRCRINSTNREASADDCPARINTKFARLGQN